MVQIIIGSALLSIIHAAIPNHWVPLVLIGRTENWTIQETRWATLLTGLAHITSTIVIGIAIGFLGFKLSNQYSFISEIIAPVVLISMGIIYFILNRKHHHKEQLADENLIRKKSKRSILITLTLAMFLSPCMEIETYFFTAGIAGWFSIITIAVIYLIVTLSGMLLLVTLGYKSLEKYNWHFLEHNEKKITGIILIAIGILSFFIKI